MAGKAGQKQSVSDRAPRSSSDGKGTQDWLVLKDRALAATAEGVTITDCSQRDNPIIYANAGFERLTGYPVEEVLGKNCRFLQGPDTERETVATLRKAVEEQRECTVEILNYRKDGAPFWNRLSVTPLRNSTGQVTHFIGVQSDITERKRSEEALRAAKEQLETASQRMKKDLEAAAKIQQSLLPSAVPEIQGVGIAWSFRPCQELAGDILNIFALDARHLGLYLLDVSGHGVSSALLSVTLSRWLSPISGQSYLFTEHGTDPTQNSITSPAEVAEELNRQFPLDPRTEQYFTILYGVLDRANHKFSYVSAGHPPLIRMSRKTKPKILEGSSFPIGIVRNPEYETRVLRLMPADRLYFYTDGLVEAENDQGEQFGASRLLREIAKNRSEPISRSLTLVMESVDSWCRNSALRDDISMMAVEITD